jgi:hypothetical protein
MFKTKLIISLSIFVIFLVVTSAIKNETRVIEKKISNLNAQIKIKKNDINETQLDFYYLTSPAEIEKKLNETDFNKYQPIKYSNIYFNVNNFIKINNKFTDLKKINEKKIQKK